MAEEDGLESVVMARCQRMGSGVIEMGSIRWPPTSARLSGLDYTGEQCRWLQSAWSSDSQMNTSLDLCAWNFFEAAGCLLDRVVAWFIVADAGYQLL